jgi:hypothetical protein
MTQPAAPHLTARELRIWQVCQECAENQQLVYKTPVDFPPYFLSFEAASEFIKERNLPLGWVAKELAIKLPQSNDAVISRSWVDCPVCGEHDMRREVVEEEAALITCLNHNCGSNGGTNWSAAPGQQTEPAAENKASVPPEMVAGAKNPEAALVLLAEIFTQGGCTYKTFLAQVLKLAAQIEGRQAVATTALQFTTDEDALEALMHKHQLIGVAGDNPRLEARLIAFAKEAASLP